MNYTVVVWGGTLLLSLVYFYFPKYGGVYWFTGPVSTVRDETDSFEPGKTLPDFDAEVKNVGTE